MRVKNAIHERQSTRTFKHDDLTADEIKQISSVVSHVSEMVGPFQHQFDFTFRLNTNRTPGGQKIGTYGLLRNVPAFIGGVATNERFSLIDFGFVFEHLILELTKAGFDTCWLGGTFRRNDYQKQLGDDEVIPAISPVGHRAKHRTLVDQLLRSGAQSIRRKDFSELFHDAANGHLVLDYSNPIIESLALVRRGPSASNRQPWRASVDGDTVRWYLARTPNYARLLKYDIQLLDIGIALAHFTIGLRSNHVAWTIEVEDGKALRDDWEYVCTIHVGKS